MTFAGARIGWCVYPPAHLSAAFDTVNHSILDWLLGFECEGHLVTEVLSLGLGPVSVDNGEGS